MPALDHPSPADLQAFAVGTLPEDLAQAVESHLAGCPSCLAVAAAAPDDTLVTLLRTAETSQAGPVTPGPAHAETVGLSQAGLAAESIPGPPEFAHHTRYRLIRPLGRGGMGHVWLAEHTVMGRPVALKLIRPEFLDKPDAVERFRREVRAAAKLKHPNIVAAHDADQAGGLHFLVMEYIDGETLAERIAAGPVPVEDACRWVIDAARGLEHARENGLIHRDVKPHNLILERSTGRVKVLDFGLAGVATGESSGLTGGNVVIGTPDYISPEQAEDARTADTRSDVYSLGCTLYHLLAGRPPHPGDAVLKKLDAHRHREPEPLTAIRQDMTPALAELVARMLAKDPAARPQTPGEVAVALEAILAGRGGEPPTPARRRDPGDGERGRRWLLRRIALVAVIALGIVVGALVVRATRDGVLAVRTDYQDGQSVVAVKKDGQFIQLVSVPGSIDLPAGTYDLELRAPLGYSLSHNRVEVASGGSVTVVVDRDVGGVAGPPLPPLGPAAPAEDGWTDLTPLVDPAKDAEVGRSARDDRGPGPALVVASTDDDHARVRLPFRPEGSYEVRATITRTEGHDGFILVLPIPAGLGANPTAGRGMGGFGNMVMDLTPCVGLHVDRFIDDGGWSGLKTVSPRDAGGPMSRTFGGRMEPGKAYPLYARVTADRNKVTIRGELAGKVLVHWSGQVDEVAAGPMWTGERSSRLAMGVMNGAFRVERIEARLLPGTGPATPAGPLTLHGRPDAPWTDLLPIVDASLDREAGTVTKYYDGPKAVVVVGTGVGRLSRVAVPARPDGDYEVRTRITRISGTDSFNLMLPVPGAAGPTQIGIRIDTRQGRDVVTALDWPGGVALPLDKTLKSKLRPGQAYDVVARVATSEGPVQVRVIAPIETVQKRVHFRVEVNGEGVLWWDGPAAHVREATTAFTNDRRCVGFGATASEFRVEGFEFRMLSGSAPVGRAVQPVKAAAAPQVVTVRPDDQWTDLVPLVDVTADREGGELARETVDGRPALRVKAPAGFARVALPVRPDGEYEVRTRITRLDGRDSFNLMLPIPGPLGRVQVGLIVDGFPEGGGFTGLEWAKGPGSPMQKAFGGRLVNGRAYDLLARVTARGGRVAVRAEVDGKPVLTWEGPHAAVQNGVNFFTNDRRHLGFGACASTYRVERFEVRMLSGTAQMTRSGPAPGPRVPDAPKAPAPGPDAD